MAEQEVKISLDMTSAMKVIDIFMKEEDIPKEQLLPKIKSATSTAVWKIGKYQRKYDVDMENAELLRDVIFFGTSYLELDKHNTKFYHALVRACAFLVERGTGKKIDKKFIKKLQKSKVDFHSYEGVHMHTVAFFFLFKSHFRAN